VDAVVRRPHDPALRFVIAYKLVKGAFALFASVVFTVLLAFGLGQHISDIAWSLRHHFTGAWSVEIAKAITEFAGSGHLWLVSLALAFDGTLTLVEGWALHMRRWWGPWLVVVATSVLLPFEVVALVHHRRLGRAFVLLANVAIVVFLARRALSERARARREEGVQE
jgi:uncharacterized membrane protein (DUF2068 family)